MYLTFVVRRIAQNFMPDSLHEVGFAQPNAAIYKERIVGLTGFLRYR